MAQPKEPRIAKVLRNMVRLSDRRVSPEDTLTYLKSEGYDAKSFANAVGKYNQSQGVIADFGPVKSDLQGLTFGFSDEAEAAFKALTGKGTYEQNLAAIGLAKQEFEQESPGTALASELAGGVPLMFLGGAGALQAAGRLPQLARLP